VNEVQRLRFVQLELAGTVGLEDGRYLARDPERVLVVRVAGAPLAPRRRLRKRKPAAVAPEPDAPTVPLTTLTVVDPQPLGGSAEAESWLAGIRDSDLLEETVADAVGVANAAVHAYRAASLDPAVADVSAARALTVRVGYGSGESLADGRWEEAIELPGAERARRIEALAPQERVAAALGRREPVDAATGALLRARGDLDAGRPRDAALQLRVGLEAMLADREAFGGAGQAEDLAALGERRGVTGEAANAALTGPLPPERVAELEQTLRLCERVLRRRRAYG
jgi:hypothetical protein